MGGVSRIVSRARADRPRLTPFHQRVAAEALTARGGGGASRLAPALAHSAVDLNPHQIEAAAFALASLSTGGAVLADEVGLGKTIEAGLVLAQLAAEGKGRAVILVPASLRAQWRDELSLEVRPRRGRRGRRQRPRRGAARAQDEPLRHRRHRHLLAPLRGDAGRRGRAGPLGRRRHRRGPPAAERLPARSPHRPGAAQGAPEVPEAPPHRDAAPERPHGAARPRRLHRRRAPRERGGLPAPVRDGRARRGPGRRPQGAPRPGRGPDPAPAGEGVREVHGAPLDRRGLRAHARGAGALRPRLRVPPPRGRAGHPARRGARCSCSSTARSSRRRPSPSPRTLDRLADSLEEKLAGAECAAQADLLLDAGRLLRGGRGAVRRRPRRGAGEGPGRGAGDALGAGRAARLRPARPDHQVERQGRGARARPRPLLHRGEGLRLAGEGGGLHRVPPHPGPPREAARVEGLLGHLPLRRRLRRPTGGRRSSRSSATARRSCS